MTTPISTPADETLLSPTDEADLEREVMAMYRDVAQDPASDFHFELGRALAQRLGYPTTLLNLIPSEAVDSFAGVGHHLDLAAIAEAEHVVDLGSGSGTDVFAAASLAGPDGRVVGVEMTPEQLRKAERLRAAGGFEQVEFVSGRVERLALPDASVDVVISNGVINLVPDKASAFAEIARVLRPGGRLAIADIVSSREIAPRTVAKVELWAACVAGAITGDAYVAAIEAAGLRVERVRENPQYRFASERAAATSAKYGVKSVSILATKPVG